MALQQRKKEAAEAEELTRLCEYMDTDNSGTISSEEFEHILSNRKLRTKLALLGLDIKDAQMFFEMLCALEGTTEVDIDAFVGGCMRLKGVATSVDLQSLLYQVKVLQKTQNEFYEDCADRLDLVMDAMQLGQEKLPLAAQP